RPRGFKRKRRHQPSNSRPPSSKPRRSRLARRSNFVQPHRGCTHPCLSLPAYRPAHLDPLRIVFPRRVQLYFCDSFLVPRKESAMARSASPVALQAGSQVRAVVSQKRVTAAPRLSVVVVNYRQWEKTGSVVRQLSESASLGDGAAEVVIVDNHSPKHP